MNPKLSTSKLHCTLYLVLRVLCICACFLSTASLGLTDPPLWTSVRQISLGLASASQPSIQAYRGKVYVVWSDNRLKKPDLFFRYSADDGISWSEEERVSDTDGEALEPSLAYDGKFLHLIWREKKQNGSEIRYKRWDGKAWGHELILFKQSESTALKVEDAKNPTIVATKLESDPIIYAAWEVEFSKGSKGASVYITQSFDRGKIWSEPKPLVKGDWSTKEPALAAGVRETYILWRDEREASGAIFFKRLALPENPEPNTPNLNLNLEVRLSSTKDCKRPNIFAFEPFIYVAWECSKTSRLDAEIFATQSDDKGETWTNAQPLFQSQADQASPHLIADDKQIWIFWQDGSDGNWEIYAATSPNVRATGQSPLQTIAWSAPVRLTKSDAASINPKADLSSNQIHLIWEEQNRSLTGLKSNIAYIKYDPLPPKRPGVPIHRDLTAPKGYDDDNLLDYTWESSAVDVVKYQVFASVDGGDFVDSGSASKPRFQLKAESGKKYKIFVTAIDEVGNKSEVSMISDEVEVDTEAPKATIDRPQNNSSLINSTYVTVSCTDVNLSKCSLDYGASASPKIWKPLLEPIQIQNELKKARLAFWDIAGLNLNGTYILRLTASDKANNRTEVRTNVIIDRSPPIDRHVEVTRELIASNFGFSYLSPAWAPDSSKIAYASNEGGSFDIWTININASGKETTRITNNPAVELNPSWSPKPDKLAFQVLNGDNWDLWIADLSLKDKNLKPLLSTLASEKEPAWSPSGEEIAFISDVDGDDELWLLLNVSEVIAGKPPNLLQLTHNRWGDSRPSWSPDGTKIAFQSNRGGDWNIFQVEVDGTNEKELTKTSADEVSPRWSANGKQLLFISNGQLWALNLISNLASKLSDLPEETQSADWSPKNDQVIYETSNSLKIAFLSTSEGRLIAKITSPKYGELISGKVEIFGIASGSNFKGYKIEYSPDVNVETSRRDVSTDSNWTQVETVATSEVAQIGFLGFWDTEALSGNFRLRLTVMDIRDQVIQDEARISLLNHQPQLLVFEPKDGMITDKEEIQLQGSIESDSILRVNKEAIFLDGKTEFSVPFSLKDGLNQILIEVEGISGKRTALLRKVTLDSKAPEISVDSPTDFQTVSVPHILISGKVNEEAKLKISAVELSPDKNGNFNRRIGLSEGTNVILIEATDRVGHISSVIRRVIYQQEQRGRKDLQPPAIVDVWPPENAVVQTQQPRLLARLVDDLGIDSDSIKFSLDGKELKKGIFSFDPNTGALSYEPSQPISDGVHGFTIEVQDTSENKSEPLKSSFVVDSQPTLINLTAELLEDISAVRIILTSNKKIASIPAASLIPNIPNGFRGGYSIQFDLVKANKDLPEHQVSLLPLTHLLSSFMLEAITIDNSGGQVDSFGVFAWTRIQSATATKVEAADGTTVEIESTPLKPNQILTLRSQDGLDPERINLQQQDAKLRDLRPVGLVYQIQVLGAEKEEFEFTLSLPHSDKDKNKNNVALFYWNERLKRWTAIEGERRKAENRIVGALLAAPIRAKVRKQGFYALLADSEPPTISSISPKDGKEVPIEKFLVEAKVSDRGAGVSEVELRVDSKLVEFIYNPDNGQLSYLPSDLDLGLHILEIKATDRAGNMAQVESRFFTRDVFDFADEVFNFPNPTSLSSTIIFKLTKSADVKLNIYDISGKLIYTDQLKNSVGYGGGPKGEKFVWDGKNRSGERVSSGIYIYLIEADREGKKIRRSGKIAVVK